MAFELMGKYKWQNNITKQDSLNGHKRGTTVCSYQSHQRWPLFIVRIKTLCKTKAFAYWCKTVIPCVSLIRLQWLGKEHKHDTMNSNIYTLPWKCNVFAGYFVHFLRFVHVSSLRYLEILKSPFTTKSTVYVCVMRCMFCSFWLFF